MLKTKRSRRRGFTLIELMIAVAIVGILLRVALPVYWQSIQKAHRTDAKTALFDLAAREQQYYSTNNAYTATTTLLGYATTPSVAVVNSGTTSYTLTVQVPDPASNNAVSFLATATPSGKQADDTACGSYTLSSTGAQGNSGTATACW